jgi:hypothetical protein
MSDTGEQGMTPQDPADQAGIGIGITPDDKGEGYEQAALASRRTGDDQNGDHDDESEADGSAASDAGGGA